MPRYIYFLIELIQVTVVSEIVWVSRVQLFNTSSIYHIVYTLSPVSSPETFLVFQRGRCYWQFLGRGWGCAKHRTFGKPALHNKELSCQCQQCQRGETLLIKLSKTSVPNLFVSQQCDMATFPSWETGSSYSIVVIPGPCPTENYCQYFAIRASRLFFNVQSPLILVLMSN